MNARTFIIALLLFSCLSLKGQPFTKDYFEYFSGQWEKEVTDSMRNSVDPKMDSLFRATTGKGFWEIQQETALRSTEDAVERFSYILEAFGVSDADEESIIIIEEKRINPLDANFSNQINGVIHTSSSTGYYSFDAYFRIFERSNFPPFDQVFFEYLELLANEGFEAIGPLARAEAASFQSGPAKSIEYQIISYDKKRNETVKVAYLHEKRTK